MAGEGTIIGIVLTGGVLVAGAMYFNNPSFRSWVDSGFQSGIIKQVEGSEYVNCPEQKQLLSMSGPNLRCNCQSCTWHSMAGGKTAVGHGVSPYPLNTAATRARDAFCQDYNCSSFARVSAKGTKIRRFKNRRIALAYE